jgi:hypothetical protein
VTLGHRLDDAFLTPTHLPCACVSALPYWLTGFKRHHQRIGNNTAKTMLPQEDGTEIFWGVTKITEAETLPKYWIGDPDCG